MEVGDAEEEAIEEETATGAQTACEGRAGVSVPQHAVQPAVGTLLWFTSGSENVHYVRRVLSGVRYALTIAFTRRMEDSVEQALSDRYDQRVTDWREQRQSAEQA